jgi:hypothetical protein
MNVHYCALVSVELGDAAPVEASVEGIDRALGSGGLPAHTPRPVGEVAEGDAGRRGVMLTPSSVWTYWMRGST